MQITGTILDYLIEYKDVSFNEMRFTEVDAAILTKLSYFHFDRFVPTPESGMPSIQLKQIMLMDGHEDLYNYTRGKYEENHEQLIELMLSGKRFENIRIAAFSNYFDVLTQTQFAAVTFLLNAGRMFVAFRGTDSSIIGLKEDFNLLYMDHAPCHDYAINYLKMVSSQFKRRMYVGGHSKGGHLAIYASLFMPDEIQERIQRIYSMDGLGLRPSVMEKGNYEKIKNKVFKLIPQSSLIGMMLQGDDDYDVVKSNGMAIVQHNVYTWEVDGRKFVRRDKLNNNAVFVDHTLNGWMESQNDESRQIFIDAVYSIVEKCKAEHLHDLISGRGNRLTQILEGMRELDDTTADKVKAVLHAFVDVANFYLKADVGGNIKQTADREKDLIITSAGNVKKRARKLKNSAENVKRKIIHLTEGEGD